MARERGKIKKRWRIYLDCDKHIRTNKMMILESIIHEGGCSIKRQLDLKSQGIIALKQKKEKGINKEKER